MVIEGSEEPERRSSEPERIGDMFIVKLYNEMCELNNELRELNKNICELKELFTSLKETKKKSNQKKNITIDDDNLDNNKIKINQKRNIYTKNKVTGPTVDPDFAKTLSPELLSFYEGFAKFYPSVCMMDLPLKYEQYATLCQLYSTKRVNEKIAELENYKGIKNYKSAYRTLGKWLRR